MIRHRRVESLLQYRRERFTWKSKRKKIISCTGVAVNNREEISSNMKGTLVLVVFACMIAFYAEVGAEPSDMDTKPKDVKEPKEIKDAATASKDVKDAIKNAKDAMKGKKDCIKPCPSAYHPVCAHDLANSNIKPMTFGTPCLMENHNCEMGTKLVVKAKGECPGAVGLNL